MGASTLRSEAVSRGARMLRTALGPAIAAWLEDPGVIKVMLNPDGRIWIDRLADGLADTGEWLAPADGERIIRLVAHHVGPRSIPVTHASPLNCPKQASVLKACFRQSSRRPPSPSASRRSPSSRLRITSPPESCLDLGMSQQSDECRFGTSKGVRAEKVRVEASGPRWRRREAQPRRQGGGCRLRARLVDGDDGQGFPEL
jgi:hypothetical protein